MTALSRVTFLRLTWESRTQPSWSPSFTRHRFHCGHQFCSAATFLPGLSWQISFHFLFFFSLPKSQKWIAYLQSKKVILFLLNFIGIQSENVFLDMFHFWKCAGFLCLWTNAFISQYYSFTIIWKHSTMSTHLRHCFSPASCDAAENKYV